MEPVAVDLSLCDYVLRFNYTHYDLEASGIAMVPKSDIGIWKETRLYAMTPSSTMDGNVSCFTLARRSPEEQAVLREALENSLHLLTMRYELVQVSVISASNVHDLLIQTKPLWDEWAMATMMRDNPLLSASLELENLFGTWADAALHYLARASNERLLWAPLHMADASLGDKLIKVGIHDSLRSRSDSVRSMVDDGGFSD